VRCNGINDKILGVVWFTFCNVNDNGNDTHLSTDGNKFE
jgi:hypothetical protein